MNCVPKVQGGVAAESLRQKDGDADILQEKTVCSWKAVLIGRTAFFGEI